MQRAFSARYTSPMPPAPSGARIELLLLIRKPQFIPDPVPFARSLEAVVTFQLAGVISDRGPWEAVQKAAREEVIRFLKI